MPVPGREYKANLRFAGAPQLFGQRPIAADAANSISIEANWP
jgi:hypothetical protein